MNATTRNLLDHAAGKGDKPRTKLDDNFRKRFAEIQWDPWNAEVGFKNVGNKKIKTYGRSKW